MSTARARRHFVLYNVLLAAAALLLGAYLLFLRLTGFSYVCRFSLVTHLYCAGCGCTRATWALLAGDLFASLTANPFVLLSLALFVYYEGAFYAAWRRGGRVRSLPLILYAAALVIYAILRNLLLTVWGIDPLGNLLMYWRT